MDRPMPVVAVVVKFINLVTLSKFNYLFIQVYRILVDSIVVDTIK